MSKPPHANHTACKRNTNVIVKLIDGTVFEDKFLDRKGNRLIIFKEHGAIKKKDIRLFAIKRIRPTSLKG